ncbi:hypothetical protein EDB81DRAFT_857361 [Dactylonectria macrodidyma]|uniref:BRCT domain-containing protein n=1 Tax=Dactylonectria macrodidyma TaxID=307937 RepID=A0A9P9ET66_9HYPO|nr:hypothetical protein EDB81DRAFT_857361 [Dactylonectria macrodidyma]
MPRQIFKNYVIAAAGPLPGQLTVENLKRWTQIRKGRFTNDFNQHVTHLLCTREQFNKKVPLVREALKRGKRFHIVHCDWFMFSAMTEQRQPEREYSMRNIIAKQNAAKREQARIEKGKKEGEKFINANFFHIYIDREFFPYRIDITRDDETAGEFGQRYTLCLWESDAKPRLYWFTAKFLKKKGNSQPSYYRPSPCSGKWRTEMDLFMEFFRIKTGLDWEDRVTKMNTMPHTFFQYSPPAGGKPVGRRLRFNYDYCREVNAELRGLAWPPPEDTTPPEQDTSEIGPLLPDIDDEHPLSQDGEAEDYEQAPETSTQAQTASHVPDNGYISSSQDTTSISSERSGAESPSSTPSLALSFDESTCRSPEDAACAGESQNDDEDTSDRENSIHPKPSDAHSQIEELLGNPELTEGVEVIKVLD